MRAGIIGLLALALAAAAGHAQTDSVQLQTEAIPLPGFAQSYTQLDDGTILFNETEDPYSFWLSRRSPDGSIERLWDCSAWMAAWRDDYCACASNTITFHPDRGSVLYSMFMTDTVVELDPTRGEVLIGSASDREEARIAAEALFQQETESQAEAESTGEGVAG